MIVAAIKWSDEVNVGVLIVGILIVVIFALGSLRERQSERWRKLYDLADAERKQLAESLREATAQISEQKEIIARLDGLQMPVKIVEMMRDLATTLNTAADERLSAHEARAQERHDGTIAVLDAIATRLGNGSHA